MNLEDAFDWFIVCWAVITGARTLAIAVYFLKSPEGIGKAVAYDKLAEFFNVAVICFFALTQKIGILEDLSITEQNVIRLFAITFVLGSSIHLSYQTKKIIADINAGRWKNSH